METYDYARHSPLRYDEFRLLKLYPGSCSSDLESNLVRRRLCTQLRSDNTKPTRTGNTRINSARLDVATESPNSVASKDSANTDKDIDNAISETNPDKNRSSGKISKAPIPEPYEALSYTWGSDDASFSIKVLAESQAYYISIRSNLNAALRQLRSEKEAKFFWIDALCINQDDEDEKSSQIRRISEIYSEARNVCVWLGTEEDHSAEAIKLIKRCVNLDVFDRLIRDRRASREWGALSALMRRPWFRRRWIIQEIALAREAIVHCGSENVPWTDFADVMSLLASNQHVVRQLFRESTDFRNHPDYLGDLMEYSAIRLVHTADNLFRKSEDGEIMEKLFSLEGLMSSLSAFDASCPHDIVYAVLWLANDARPVSKDAFTVETHNQYGTPLQSPTLTTSSVFPESRRPSFDDYDEHESSETTFDKGLGISNVSKRPNLGVSLEVLQPRKRARAMPSVISNPVSDGGVTVAGPTVDHDDEDHDTNAAVAMSNQVSSISEGRTTTGDQMISTGRIPLIQLMSPVSHRSIPSRSSTCPCKGSCLCHRLPNEQEKTQNAALMFVNKLEGKRFRVDYKKSVFEVCKDFLAFSITRSKSLDMLCRPWAPDDASLPSWVPRLSGNPYGLGIKGAYRRVNADPLVGFPGFKGGHYQAAPRRFGVWRPKKGAPNSLLVEGFVLDTIKDKKAYAAAGAIPAEWVGASGWVNLSGYPPDKFWRTLVGNRDAQGQRPPPHWKTACRDAFSRIPAGGDLSIRDCIMYECSSPSQGFLERVQCVVWARRLVFFNRLETSLGLAPSKAKKGDLVCILYGCSVPVLLRKFVDGELASKKASIPPDADVYYEFVGECYVHGMMDGEALSIKQKFKMEDQQFELR